MDSNITIEVNSLSQNRAEEFGFDILNEFVLPPIYGNIDFTKSAKSKVFIGGRGCGKTMLIRYLCHETKFSKNKSEITDSDFKNIGIYWKPETYAVHQLQKRGLDNEIWQDAFEHFFSLIVSIEIIKSVESIAVSKYNKLKKEDLKEENFISFNNFGLEFSGNLFSFKALLKRELNKFQFWIKNIKKRPRPVFYPKTLFEEIILTFQNTIPILKTSLFNIYIDEYENLVTYQKKIINTWVKHSEKPIIFNLAMKRNAFHIKETVGNESLSDIHDYRIYDLEEYFEELKDFEVFASEVLLYRLAKNNLINLKGFDPNILIDINKLDFRANESYKNQIIQLSHSIFPSKTEKELALDIFSDKTMLAKINNRLEIILARKKSNYKPNDFHYPNDPRVTIVSLALLNRATLSPKDIITQIENVKNNIDNKFFGKTNWVHNNFIGCYLLFYSGLPKFCPFYSGFSAFCLMSKGNIRHLMELCYKTFIRASEKNSTNSTIDVSQISLLDQAKAAKQASTTFLNEIKTFGKYGNQLHTLALRIGSLFSMAQLQLKQSEPERNHFSLAAGGNSNLSLESQNILIESLKWSVFFEQKSTKKKNKSSPDVIEYVLNPIYSSYFHISYRKRRKIELTTNELQNIIYGTLDNYKSVINKYNRKWEIPRDNQNPTLFSKLTLDDEN